MKRRLERELRYKAAGEILTESRLAGLGPKMFFDHIAFGLNFPECEMSKSRALVECRLVRRKRRAFSVKKTGGILNAVPSDVLNNKAMKC
jgi:hypothetical protein